MGDTTKKRVGVFHGERRFFLLLHWKHYTGREVSTVPDDAVSRSLRVRIRHALVKKEHTSKSVREERSRLNHVCVCVCVCIMRER